MTITQTIAAGTFTTYLVPTGLMTAMSACPGATRRSSHRVNSDV